MLKRLQLLYYLLPHCNTYLEVGCTFSFRNNLLVRERKTTDVALHQTLKLALQNEVYTNCRIIFYNAFRMHFLDYCTTIKYINMYKFLKIDF